MRRRLRVDSQSFIRRATGWGLTPAPRDSRAALTEQRWRWPTLLVLLGTVPAFYADLLHSEPSALADAAYLCAALMVGCSLLHVAWRTRQPVTHVLANFTDVLLVLGLVSSALLPSSHGSAWALGVRLGVAFMTLLRMLWSVQHLITRGGLTYLLLVSVLVLGACGLGFWWLEPSTPTLADGMWLAFTTAATVGYGDLVPTTPASRIFAVFVVLLGFGVLTLVTAAIAASWVETEERIIEREILHDVRREIATLRHELSALREELAQQRSAAPTPALTKPSDETESGASRQR